MAGETCAACACEIPAEQVASAQVLRRDDKIFCADCARLLNAAVIPIPQAIAPPSTRAIMGAAGGMPEPKTAESEPEKPKKLRRFFRRSGAARKAAANADSDSPGKREDRGARRGGKRRTDDSSMTIAIFGGVLALVVIGGAFMAFGGSKPETVKKTEVKDEGDKTPSHVYAERAEEALKRGDRIGAADLYQRAATQAEKREGNTLLAQNYNIKQYDLRKFSTLDMGKGK